MAFIERLSQHVFTPKQTHIQLYVISFRVFQQKNENKKQYTIEIEGAMVKRQLQTWINCIMSPVVTLVPVSVPH